MIILRKWSKKRSHAHEKKGKNKNIKKFIAQPIVNKKIWKLVKILFNLFSKYYFLYFLL